MKNFISRDDFFCLTRRNYPSHGTNLAIERAVPQAIKKLDRIALSQVKE